MERALIPLTQIENKNSVGANVWPRGSDSMSLIGVAGSASELSSWPSSLLMQTFGRHCDDSSSWVPDTHVEPWSSGLQLCCPAGAFQDLAFSLFLPFLLLLKKKKKIKSVWLSGNKGKLMTNQCLPVLPSGRGQTITLFPGNSETSTISELNTELLMWAPTWGWNWVSDLWLHDTRLYISRTKCFLQERKGADRKHVFSLLDHFKHFWS